MAQLLAEMSIILGYSPRQGLSSRWSLCGSRGLIVSTKTIPFDAAQYLGSPELQTALLADTLEFGDAAYIAIALGVIARVRGMAEIDTAG